MLKSKLIIFVKNEEAGKVKTRLAKAVGNDMALDIYRKLLAYTREITEPLPVHKEVWYSRFIPKNDIWDQGNFKKRLQSGQNLGKRMLNAFRKSFENEGYAKVVIIGSDCAELTSGLIENAFGKLDDYEFTIGPAEDGGYYLLGMRGFHPEVFDKVEWSTNDVFTQTVKNIKVMGANYAKLEELNDVDTIEDWEKQKSNL